jgi:hypothetical protein
MLDVVSKRPVGALTKLTKNTKKAEVLLGKDSSRDGDIGKKDGYLLIGVYALFVVIQYLFEALIV